MIHLSEKAAAEIKRLLQQKSNGEQYLRVQVVGGGCSGMSYKLEFEKDKKDSDKVFSEHGVSLIVDPKSYLFVINTTLEFSDGLNGKGFSFDNPNAKKHCGCGSSFAV